MGVATADWREAVFQKNLSSRGIASDRAVAQSREDLASRALAERMRAED